MSCNPAEHALISHLQVNDRKDLLVLPIDKIGQTLDLRVAIRLKKIIELVCMFYCVYILSFYRRRCHFLDWYYNKKVSYRKQTARQHCLSQTVGCQKEFGRVGLVPLIGACVTS